MSVELFLKRADKKHKAKVKLETNPLEKTISDVFADKCRAAGFVVLPLVIHKQRTFPDWTVINKNGVVGFIELKRKTNTIKQGQLKTKTRLEDNNAIYYKIDDITLIDGFISAFSAITLRGVK